MKIGVVGLGFMGATHLEAYSKIPGAEVVAVSSGDEKKLAGDLSESAGNLDTGLMQVDFSGVATYKKAEDLIADPNVEAVDLCAPTFVHTSLGVQALEAGKHVLVEKPMGLTPESCDELIAAAEKSGKTLMVAQVLRFFPDWTAMYELIKSGELGEVKHAFFYRRCAAPAWSKWMKDKERSGGGVFDLLIHDVDFCNLLFGKPASVTATGFEDLAAGIDVIEAHFEYPDGPLVTVSGGWRHPKAYPFSSEFTIVCEKGTLDFHSATRPLTVFKSDGLSEEVEKPDVDGFQAELEAFLRACETGEAPEGNSPRDSALSTRMTLGMRDSRDQGGVKVTF